METPKLNPDGKYVDIRDASNAAKEQKPYNQEQYRSFVKGGTDPHLPLDPNVYYPIEDWIRIGGWDGYLGREPAPQPPVMAVPTLASAPDQAPPPVVETPPPATVATMEMEEPDPLPLVPKPSVLTGRPKRPRPPPVEEAYDPPPPLVPKPRPRPEPKKPAEPKVRREDIKSPEARVVYDFLKVCTNQWDD